MDTAAKLIICVILGAFYAPTVSAYEFTDPYPNVRVIDGDLHIQRPGGGTTLAYPNAGISKEIPVNTSKGNFLVPVEKTFPVEPSKVGKAAVRFAKLLPPISIGLALYDVICDLSGICNDDGNWGKIPTGHSVVENQAHELTGGWIYNGGNIGNTLADALNYMTCNAANYCEIIGSTVTETQLVLNYFIYRRSDGANIGSFSLNKAGFNQSQLPPVAQVSPTEQDWQQAETDLNAHPQQTAEALYNSDAPVPVLASTQSAPVTQQIAQTSTQTKDAQGNITGTQVATTSVKVEDTSTTNNVTYNVTEVTTITTYNENNEITNTQTSTSDNSPPKTGTDETTISFDDVPPAQLEEEAPEFDLFSPVSWGEGTCPPDETLDLSLTSLTISWEPTCNVAEQLRPILILFASIAAMYIVSGVSRE